MSDYHKKARPLVVSGYSSRNLAQGIADYMGCKVVDVRDKEHADNEIEPAILSNVRGREVILVASSAGNPNKQMFETQLLLDSLRRADAKSVTLVVPYMWYGRSDSNFSERKSPALSTVIGNISNCARAIVADPHNSGITREVFQAHGTNCLVTSFAYSYAAQLTDMFNKQVLHKDKVLFLHPDAGSTKRIDPTFRDALYTTLGFDKTEARWNPNKDSWPQIGKDRDKETNQSSTKEITVDVDGMDVVIFEDMIASGGTACDLAAGLKKAGARSVTLFASNGLFTPKKDEKEAGNLTASVDRINNSVLDYVFVTNTYDHSAIDAEIHEAIQRSDKIHTLDVSPYLGAILEAMHMEVFDDTPEDANSVSAIMRGKHAEQAKMAKVVDLPVRLPELSVA